MTKRYFIRAAEIVNAIREGHWTDDLPPWADDSRDRGVFSIAATSYIRAVQTAEAFIVLATEFNPRFDTNRFLIACGLVDAPVKATRGKR